MRDGRQQDIQGIEIPHRTEGAITEMQPALRASQPFIDLYLAKRYAPLDVLARNAEKLAVGLQVDHPNAR
jgi:hypothetical protein